MNETKFVQAKKRFIFESYFLEMYEKIYEKIYEKMY